MAAVEEFFTHQAHKDQVPAFSFVPRDAVQLDKADRFVVLKGVNHKLDARESFLFLLFFEPFFNLPSAPHAYSIAVQQARLFRVPLPGGK